MPAWRTSFTCSNFEFTGPTAPENSEITEILHPRNMAITWRSYTVNIDAHQNIYKHTKE